MSWRAPTEDDLVATLSAKEVALYRQAASFAADPVESLLARTSAYVLGYVRAGGITIAADPHALPEALISPAMDYAAYDVLKRLPTAVGGDRRKARDAAQAVFERVAAGKFAIEPANETEDTTHANTPVYATAKPTRLLD